MKRFALGVLCAWIVMSQHRGSDSNLWWRIERGPISESECYAALKAVSGHPKVAPSKWYDVTTQQLHDAFGTVATPTKGSWVTCWPQDLWDDQRGEPKWTKDQ